MKNKLFMLSLAFLLLTGCGPDPRREADAYATRAEADRATSANDQSLEQAEELHQLELERQQIDLETKQDTVGTLREGLKILLWASFLFLTAAVCFAIFKSAQTFSVVAQGVGAAIVRKADVRANLIMLDPITRQYPVFLQYQERGRFALVNPNLNSVTMLDTRSEPDRQLIAAVSGVQIAGVIAQEARKSSDPASIAIMQPPIVEAQEGELLTGVRLMAEIKEASQILAGGGHE